MIPIEQLKQWIPGEIYQEYVKMLLEQHPLVEDEIKERPRDKKRRGWVTRKVYNRGYWTRFNKRTNTSHYWVYTKKVVGGRHRVEEVISYARFMAILDAWFSKAREYIIDGYALNMGNGIGCIQGMHVERNHSNPQINWQETKKQPLVDNPDGTKSYLRKVYFTDDTWVRIGWVKFSKLTNETIYEFVPSYTSHMATPGFSDIFSAAHKANPALKLKYPFYPYLQPRKEAS